MAFELPLRLLMLYLLHCSQYQEVLKIGTVDKVD